MGREGEGGGRGEEGSLVLGPTHVAGKVVEWGCNTLGTIQEQSQFYCPPPSFKKPAHEKLAPEAKSSGLALCMLCYLSIFMELLMQGNFKNMQFTPAILSGAAFY